MNLYELLEKLNIKYEEIEHEAVYTMDDIERLNIWNNIDGVSCKNLFVKDKNGYYIITAAEDREVKLRELDKEYNLKRVHFASSDELLNILGLIPGSVTPLGIINDNDNKVRLFLDNNLKGKKILIHSNVNTNTMSLEFDDLIKIIEYTKHTYDLF